MTTRPLSTVLSGLLGIGCAALVGCGGGPETPREPAPQALQRVLIEIDRMSGTRPVETEQTIGGQQVSLAAIYRSAGLELRVVPDRADLPRQDPIRLADLHALMTSSSSVVPQQGEWKVHALVVTEDADDPGTLGIMFDFGDEDTNDVPREAFAVFDSAHSTLPGGPVPELLLTTAHELAHAFNLHHTDWEGTSFTEDSTCGEV